MKIQPLAVGVLGFVAVGGIVYGAVSSVEPGSVAQTSSTANGSTPILPSTSFPILESPVSSTPAEVPASSVAPTSVAPTSVAPNAQPAPPLYQQLEGTWSSDVMTVTFDWDTGVYSGVMLGKPFSKSLEFVREQENAVIFETDGSEVVCQFRGDGAIALVTYGASSTPIVLRKSS